jgi:hypothetical protein
MDDVPPFQEADAGATIEATCARHQAFWERSEAARPLLTVKPSFTLKSLVIPVYHGIDLAPDGYLQPEMLDPESHFRQLVAGWDDAGPVDGDLFRIVTPYLLVPWLEAICGCPVRYFRDAGTMYPEAPGGSWDHVLRLRPGQAGNPWRARLREFLVVLQGLAAGRYPVGVSMPMRGPLDMLAALVGVPGMCLAFADRPALVREALDRLTDIWIDVVGEQLGLVPPFAGGMAGCEQYGLWAPGPNAVTQCDLAVVISPRAYERFLVPCDARICASMAYPIMHLHSAGLHVLEPVLSVSGLAAVQIVVDPGPADAPLLSLLPAFRRVQQAGKPLIIHCTTISQAELDALLGALSPRGLCIGGRMAEEQL